MNEWSFWAAVLLVCWQAVAVRSGVMAGDVTSIFADAHGTGTIQIANTVDRVVRRYTDPFGAVRGTSAGAPADGVDGGSGWVGDHGFLDKPLDASGLTAVGARLYDAVLGGFVSVDPVMDLADPQQWNAYAYANNNPTTYSDPTGLLPIGAGHVGYNPRDKNDKRRTDPCAGATSCVKKGAGKAPVKVRECYTAYACGFFRTHADGYTTSGGGSVGLVSYQRGSVGGQAVNRSGAAAAAQAAARAEELEVITARNAERARLTKIADQKRLWQEASAVGGAASYAAAGDFWSAFFLGQIAASGGGGGPVMTGVADELPDEGSVQIYGGGCAGVCAEGAAGLDSRHGLNMYGGTGVGVEYGASFGVGLTNGISPGLSTGISGSATVYGPLTLSGAGGFGPNGEINSYSGGGGIGLGWQYGAHTSTGRTWTQY